VVCAAEWAIIAEAPELLAENAPVLFTVQLRAVAVRLKHFYLSDFDLALRKIGPCTAVDKGCIDAWWAITDSGARLPERFRFLRTAVAREGEKDFRLSAPERRRSVVLFSDYQWVPRGRS
jgi:hypothetical protein